MFKLILLLWLAVLPCAWARPVATEPFLRLETGMHTAMINRIAVDAKQRYLVTASNDKTARLWDLTTGELLQVLRPPLGAGDEGKLYAVALAPDGSEVAVAGFTGRDEGANSNLHIYFFNPKTGRLSRAISGLPSTIKHLAYSTDGKHLAAALGSGGIRLYDTRNLQELARDTTYGNDDSYWLDFDAQGHLVSSCYDGFIRLYDAQLRLLQKQKAIGGSQPYAVRFSPDGSRIAVGFNDSTNLALLSGKDLAFLYAPNTQDLNNGNLGTVAWSSDGKTLYAGGMYDDGSGMNPLLSWSEAGRGTRHSLALSNTSIMDIQALTAQTLVYGSADPVWGIVKNGVKTLVKNAALRDYRGTALQLSDDGALIANGALQFDALAQGYSTNLQGLNTNKTTAQNFSISDWENNDQPKFNQQTFTLDPNERSHSLAISADEQHFVLGATWSLRYYDAKAQQLWRVAIPAVAWAVNLSKDGRFVVAAFGDGTVRWYASQDGKEQLALFAHPDGKRWVLWTPEGFYNASPDADSLIGYHLNAGDDHEGQFVSAKQLSKQFYRSDLISARLSGNETAIQQALAEMGDVRQVLARGAPPSVEWLDSQLQDNQLKVTVRVNDQGGGIGKIAYRINGKEQETRQVFAGFDGTKPLELTIPLPQGQNKVEIYVHNRDNSIPSNAASRDIAVNTKARRPELYLLALGVSQYQDPRLKLKFAADDAKALSDTLKLSSAALFSKQNLTTLTNQEVTLQRIESEFNRIAAQIKPDDVFVLYLAGHGMIFNGKYHYIPANAVYTSEQAMQTASLSEDKLTALLPKIHANKSVIILDTCHAAKAGQTLAAAENKTLIRGNVEEATAITRLWRGTGRAILSATASENVAMEGYQGHGYFTYALLEGLQGKADSNHDKEINVLELSGFLPNRVRKLSQERQIPVIETGSLIDFPISIKK